MQRVKLGESDLEVPVILPGRQGVRLGQAEDALREPDQQAMTRLLTIGRSGSGCFSGQPSSQGELPKIPFHKNSASTGGKITCPTSRLWGQVREARYR